MTAEQQKLVIDNEKLVYYIILKHYKPYIHDEDVKQTGILALCKAAIMFDQSKGYKFATYASQSIYNEISSFLSKNNKNINMYSLDYVYNNKDSKSECTLSDIIEDDKNYIDDFIDSYSIRENLIKLESRLNMQQFIVYDKYKSGKTCKEIAQELGLSVTYINTVMREIRSKYKRIDKA